MAEEVHLLPDLPDELLDHIALHLDARSVCALAMSAGRLRHLAHSQLLWRHLVMKRFLPLVEHGLPSDALRPGAGESWRARYFGLSTPGGANHWGVQCVAPHASLASCWTVIEDTVYDVTTFMHHHPGMAASLLLFGGVDASEPFAEVYHSRQARGLMRGLAVPGLSLRREGLPLSLMPADKRTQPRPAAPPGGASGRAPSASWLLAYLAPAAADPGSDPGCQADGGGSSLASALSWLASPFAGASETLRRLVAERCAALLRADEADPEPWRQHRQTSPLEYHTLILSAEEEAAAAEQAEEAAGRAMERPWWSRLRGLVVM